MSNEFYNNLPENYRPISPWGYIGYQILFSIPCIGLILMLVFAFSGNTNVNLRNFARSYLILILFVVILYVIMFVVMGALGFSMAEMASYSSY